jgi:hypothetical protein
MASYEINCIIPDSNDPGRRIDAVGGPVMGVHDEDTVIRWIDEGHTFWTMVNDVQAKVYVGGTILTGRYLTTSPDGYQPNNLLKLPRCR